MDSDQFSTAAGSSQAPTTGESKPTAAIVAWWHLIRGGNALLSAVAGLIGLYLTGGDLQSLAALSATAAPLLIAAFGNIDNDLCDLPLDRLWKTYRPLASGAIGTVAARRVAVVAALLGLIAAGVSGTAPLVIAFGVLALLAVYNRRLSAVPLVGNVAVAVMGGLPILYGGLCARSTGADALAVAAFGAVIAFWLHLSREILKDVLDVAGDGVMGRRTLAIVLTPETATRWAALPLIPAGAFALWLGTGDWLGILYIFGVSLTVIPTLLIAAAQCAFNPHEMVALRWTVGLKLVMLGGLIWMILGKAA
ncbi:MAG TPA: UbiA family prenyltransferase [Acidobacteriota bacterium]|nr:UbiA family prenyltransferase [Acidobacteriota bacterium]